MVTIVPELLHFLHLPGFEIHDISNQIYSLWSGFIFKTEVPSPNAEQVLPAKIIFTFTLLPQIRLNNEDLRNLACDIVLSGEHLLTFWRITYSGSSNQKTVTLFLHCLTLKMEGLWPFAISGMTHQMVASHPEDLNLSNAAVRMSRLEDRIISSESLWLLFPDSVCHLYLSILHL